MRKKRKPTLATVEADPFDPFILDLAHNLLAGTTLGRDAWRFHPNSCALVDRLLRAKGRRGLGDLESDDGSKRISSYLRRSGVPRPPRSPGRPIAQNLELLRLLFELDEVESSVLAFLLALHGSAPFRDLLDVLGEQNLVRSASLIAAATLGSSERILSALGPKSALLATGLVQIERRDAYLQAKLKLKLGLPDLALTPGLDRDQVLDRFLARAEPSTLDRSDFAEMEEPARVARKLVRAALDARRSGVNLLLRGPTGTGKTELARLLADELGVPLFCAGRADDDGESAQPSERLSSLLVANRLLGAGRALLLFDELEDLFGHDVLDLLGGGVARLALMSKQWFNLLLETNPVPTIWITNSTRGIDGAFLRRFTYSLELRPPGVRQRARMLARHLGETAALPAAEVEAIAERFDVSAAQLGSAVSAARLLSPEGRPGREEIEEILEPAARLFGGGGSLAPFDAARFRLEAVPSAEDLGPLCERLARWRPGAGVGLSLCLYGPPGTGKSELARYLAHRMRRPVVYRRVSDLQSMWVGQTEQNLAEAFREAECEGALLLLDEADSYLRDRRGAQRSWEVTQVNELLQQLEAQRGIVVCTTNLWRDLDPASLRRFVFKIELRHLDPDRALVLFEALLAPLLVTPLSRADRERTRESFARLLALAPGDLATVRRRLVALGERPSLGELLALVEAEVRVKREGPRVAGFDCR